MAESFDSHLWHINSVEPVGLIDTINICSKVSKEEMVGSGTLFPDNSETECQTMEI